MAAVKGWDFDLFYSVLIFLSFLYRYTISEFD